MFCSIIKIVGINFTIVVRWICSFIVANKFIWYETRGTRNKNYEILHWESLAIQYVHIRQKLNDPKCIYREKSPLRYIYRDKLQSISMLNFFSLVESFRFDVFFASLVEIAHDFFLSARCCGYFKLRNIQRRKMMSDYWSVVLCYYFNRQPNAMFIVLCVSNLQKLRWPLRFYWTVRFECFFFSSLFVVYCTLVISFSYQTVKFVYIITAYADQRTTTTTNCQTI